MSNHMEAEKSPVQSILTAVGKNADRVKQLQDEKAADTTSPILTYFKEMNVKKSSNNKTRPEIGQRAKSNNKKKKAARKARRLNRS